MQKNLINVVNTFELVQEQLDDHAKLLSNIESSFNEKQDFNLAYIEARGYLDIFKELNKTKAAKIVINNPNERIETLRDI